MLPEQGLGHCFRGERDGMGWRRSAVSLCNAPPGRSFERWVGRWEILLSFMRDWASSSSFLLLMMLQSAVVESRTDLTSPSFMHPLRRVQMMRREGEPRQTIDTPERRGHMDKDRCSFEIETAFR